MVFPTFAGKFVLLLRSPDRNPYTGLFEVKDDGDRLEQVCKRIGLDGAI